MKQPTPAGFYRRVILVANIPPCSSKLIQVNPTWKIPYKRAVLRREAYVPLRIRAVEANPLYVRASTVDQLSPLPNKCAMKPAIGSAKAGKLTAVSQETSH